MQQDDGSLVFRMVLEQGEGNSRRADAACRAEDYPSEVLKQVIVEKLAAANGGWLKRSGRYCSSPSV
jgi:hypothetical protein